MRESSSRTQMNTTSAARQQKEVVVQVRAGKGYAEERVGLREGHAVDRDRVDDVHALRSVGDIDRGVQIVQKDADDLAEAERHDGEVVAAQPQRRCPEHDAEEGREDRPYRQQHPPWQMDAEVRRGEQRVGIGANGIERDVAQVEQPRKADHDVRVPARAWCRAVRGRRCVPRSARPSPRGRRGALPAR